MIVKNNVPASEIVTKVVPAEKIVWMSASRPKGSRLVEQVVDGAS